MSILNGFNELLELFYNNSEWRAINEAIGVGHKKIIEEGLAKEGLSEHDKLAFLIEYKKRIRESSNCRNVIEKALPWIKKKENVRSVEEDWFSFFFDKVRLVSDDMAQTMWARILAGEVNEPGKFQRSLLHTLSIMSNAQARTFSVLASFCFRDYKDFELVHPLLFISAHVEMYRKYGVERSALLELENLGLIHCDFREEYIFLNKKVFSYGNKVIEVFGDINNGKKIKAGNVKFTADGQALYSIVGDEFKAYREEILDHIVSKLEIRNCTININGKRIV